MVLHKGSCHCGNVRFTVEAPEELELFECNCSMCTKRGAHNYHTPKENLKVDPASQQFINEYKFNTKTATYYFCKNCGICPYHQPRRNSDKNMSVNFRCVDGDTLKSFTLIPCDGKNWE
ncbi:glutathione-dependent formaldehyde-activating, GFA family protein [Gongronella butleri]|nr:glutathione-dependent formaldehyde-activating, GFA family protein [Gongronella butleri]